MLKAMIVDDEFAHRKGLIKHVRWNELGYDIPTEAEDAEEALALSAESPYNVFIVDVCMPGMNGIELVKELHLRYTDIYVLIISGYEEFEFARGAVEAGAKAYLLKPLKIEEVEYWLKKFAGMIKRKERAIEEDRLIQQKLNNSIEIAREKYLEEMLNDIGFLKEITNEQLELLELPQKDFSYYIAILSPDRYLGIMKNDPKLGSMLILRINNMAKILLSDHCEPIFIRMLPDQIVSLLIQKGSEAVSYAELDSCFHMIQESLRNENGVSMTVSISRKGSRWEDVSKLYQEALYVLNRERIDKEGQILWVSQFKQVDKDYILDFAQLQTKIISCINILDYENAMRYLNIALDEFEKMSNCSLSYVQAFAAGIIGAIISVAELSGMQTEKDHICVYEQLLNCSTIYDLRKILIGIVSRFIKYELDLRSRQKSQAIEQAIKYLHEHLNEDVTVNKLADFVHMNSSYLSVLFKKEMGETISDYVKRVRIEKAKELLRNTDMKIYEVAELVGYQTASYFAYQFKKAVGCTPAEFRDRRL